MHLWVFKTPINETSIINVLWPTGGYLFTSFFLFYSYILFICTFCQQPSSSVLLKALYNQTGVLQLHCFCPWSLVFPFPCLIECSVPPADIDENDGGDRGQVIFCVYWRPIYIAKTGISNSFKLNKDVADRNRNWSRYIGEGIKRVDQRVRERDTEGCGVPFSSPRLINFLI